MISNVASGRAAAQEVDFIDLGSSQVEQIVKNIDEYTEPLDENSDLAKKIVEGEDDGFLTKQAVLETHRSPQQHVVEKGDSISVIAQKFNVTVATILEANNIPVDKILKPGDILTIPPETTNVSTAWLDELKKKQEEQEKQRAKLRNQVARDSKKIASRDRQSSVERSGDRFNGDAEDFITPVVSSKGITRGLSRFHTGVDIRMDVGTPVISAAAGRVIEVTGGWGQGWGKSVAIDHGNGITTRYAHLSDILVSLNELVEQRQTIGLSGNSGRSTGPHLHYEMRVNGRAVKPPVL